MATPQIQTLNWGDLVTTTAAARQTVLRDQITTSTALLDFLTKRGNVKTYGGGREIDEGLEYAWNQSFQWYSGYEFINTNVNEIATIARYPLKQASIAVSISGREQRMNRGEAQIINLMRMKMMNAERSAKHFFNLGVYGDGTAYGGKIIQGLAAYVSKTPATGTIGGLNAATYTWWRNMAVDAAFDPKGALTSANIVQYFSQMMRGLTRGTDGPDLIIVSDDIYAMYEEALLPIQRINTVDGDVRAGAGFRSLVYQGIPVINDGTRGGSIPAKTAYFLNTDYLYMWQDPERNWDVVDGDRQNVNQDAVTRLMLWMGALTVSNRNMQGVLFQST